MTTSPCSASGEPRPESHYEIANDIVGRAADLRRLAEVCYSEVAELTAPNGTRQMDQLCRVSALSRAVEDYAKQLEARTSDLFNGLDKVTS